jgi:hypothetical protein
VRLVLRRGGTIACEVLDAEGRPDPGRRVEARGPGDEGIRDLESDEEGRAVFEDLAPGAYTVSRLATPQEWDAQRSSGPNLWTRFAASRSRTSAVVVDGQVTRVVVGGPKGAPIRVRGRVVDAGAPGIGITIKEGEGVEATTDSQGRFELLVPEPGNCELWLHLEEGDLWLSTLRTIRGTSSEELDLILPGGRISGVVRSREDRAVLGAVVSLLPDVIPTGIGRWDIIDGTRTTEDGRFEFHHVPAGRYELQSFVQPLTEEKGIARTPVTVVEAGNVENVVIRLP